jgi:hypothetical protein
VMVRAAVPGRDMQVDFGYLGIDEITHRREDLRSRLWEAAVDFSYFVLPRASPVGSWVYNRLRRGGPI